MRNVKLLLLTVLIDLSLQPRITLSQTSICKMTIGKALAP